MQIRVARYNHDNHSSSGILAINQHGKGAEGAVFECFTLEDEHRDVKKMSQTRIPEGTYKVGWQEAITPMTERYRAKYDWFDKHIHIKDIPNFTGVYIHIGNYSKDTAGCLLLADQAVNDPKDYDSKQLTSTRAYHRFYERVQAALNTGDEVEILIKSIW